MGCMAPNPGNAPVKAFFVQIKCDLGKAYSVATAIVDSEIASEVYSTAGDYDLLVKIYLDRDDDIGRFIPVGTSLLKPGHCELKGSVVDICLVHQSLQPCILGSELGELFSH